MGQRRQRSSHFTDDVCILYLNILPFTVNTSIIFYNCTFSEDEIDQWRIEIEFDSVVEGVTFLKIIVKYGKNYDLSIFESWKTELQFAESIKILVKADLHHLKEIQNAAILKMVKVLEEKVKNVSIELHEGAKLIETLPLLCFRGATKLNVEGVNWSGELNFREYIGQDGKLEVVRLINIHPKCYHGFEDPKLKSITFGTTNIGHYNMFMTAMPHNTLEHLYIYCSDSNNAAYISQRIEVVHNAQYEILLGRFSSRVQVRPWGNYLFRRILAADKPALFQSIDIVVPAITTCFETVCSKLSPLMKKASQGNFRVGETAQYKREDMENNIIARGQKLMVKLFKGKFKKLETDFTSIEIEVGPSFTRRRAKPSVDAIADWLSNCIDLITLVMNDQVNLFERTVFNVWLKRQKNTAVWANLKAIYGAVTSAHIASIVFYLPVVRKVQVGYLASKHLEIFFNYFTKDKGFAEAHTYVGTFRYMEFTKAIISPPVRKNSNNWFL